MRYIGSGLALLTLVILAFAGQIDNSATRPYVDAKVAAGVAEAVSAIPTSSVAYAASAGTSANSTNLNGQAASYYMPASVTNGAASGTNLTGSVFSNGVLRALGSAFTSAGTQAVQAAQITYTLVGLGGMSNTAAAIAAAGGVTNGGATINGHAISNGAAITVTASAAITDQFGVQISGQVVTNTYNTVLLTNTIFGRSGVVVTNNCIQFTGTGTCYFALSGFATGCDAGKVIDVYMKRNGSLYNLMDYSTVSGGPAGIGLTLSGGVTNDSPTNLWQLTVGTDDVGGVTLFGYFSGYRFNP